MMKIIELPPTTMPPFLMPGTKQHVARVHDGYLKILSAVEPCNDDCTPALHVSVSHSSRGGAVNRYGRAATDEELAEVAAFFFSGKQFEEDNSGATPSDTLRHLWEVESQTRVDVD